MKDLIDWLSFWLGFWMPTLFVPLAAFVAAGFWVRSLLRRGRDGLAGLVLLLVVPTVLLWLVVLWRVVRNVVAGS